MNINLYLPFIISGLGIGAVYALSGVGLVILYRATGVLNFAFGAIGAAGAFVGWQLMDMDWPLAVAIIAGVGVSTLISFLYGRFLAPLLAYRDPVVRAVGTLALAMVLMGAIGLIWGNVPKRMTFPTDRMFLDLFGVRFTYTRIIAIALALAMVIGVTTLLTTTRLGLYMRSLANDRDLSSILGVPVLKTETAAWVMTGLFAGFAGLLLADLLRVEAVFLTFMVIPAIAAAVLGQLRSLWVTLIAGFGVGIVEAVLTVVQPVSNYRTMAPYLIAVLAVMALSFLGSASAKDR
ncbi:branched-chain amino acid ABC transporter permease [Cucumibacter marinus]|uniref:branched-chain amino acid ABC transporter permease n=1 Tax=Cucumibacter marinus TaxID=1121252 RepID=UPI00040CDD60|nr:branched-chain amino acid ABC transporter permease [Cucumibacter marinus]